ncbi:unnamed protein product [Peronospora farinosa]|uniref:RRM domain-containing protein n=1 Tax=Peronospora farinosa TaxID=134698 RepID=A0AAV0U5U2_9STRA|nr:unnamed protein product [Peronospora farinosa]CAI5731014.1 unnamed protein product [Peronospora farinosa]
MALSKARRVKQDPGTIKHNANTNTTRTGHMVCITSVPSILCASERTVRDFFAEYGMLLSITIHHNFLDTESDGFIYLEYSEKEEAENAVAAVKEKSVGLAACSDAIFERAVLPSEITGMKAAMALCRKAPKLEVDEEIKDILLGRQELNRFTQSHPMDEDDDLILQSLSQHSFTNSQSKKKKRRSQAGGPVSSRLKKTKKTRSNTIAMLTD